MKIKTGYFHGQSYKAHTQNKDFQNALNKGAQYNVITGPSKYNTYNIWDIWICPIYSKRSMCVYIDTYMHAHTLLFQLKRK